MQTRRQLAQVEGLEQIIVGTGLQAVDPVGNRVAGSEHQHRQALALLTQALQQFETIFVGQAQVQHHDIEGGSLEHGLGRSRRGDPVHGHALGGQPRGDTAGNQVVILAEQYVHGRSRC